MNPCSPVAFYSVTLGKHKGGGEFIEQAAEYAIIMDTSWNLHLIIKDDHKENILHITTHAKMQLILIISSGRIGQTYPIQFRAYLKLYCF